MPAFSRQRCLQVMEKRRFPRRGPGTLAQAVDAGSPTLAHLPLLCPYTLAAEGPMSCHKEVFWGGLLCRSEAWSWFRGQPAAVAYAHFMDTFTSGPSGEQGTRPGCSVPGFPGRPRLKRYHDLSFKTSPALTFHLSGLVSRRGQKASNSFFDLYLSVSEVQGVELFIRM